MDALEMMKVWRDNPVRMVRELFGIDVQPWQAQIIRNLWATRTQRSHLAPPAPTARRRAEAKGAK